MTESTVLILSGGLDSTTVLYQLLSENKKVYALSFNYGQKAQEELKAAEKICEMNNVDHKVIDISSIMSLLESCSLINKDNDDFTTPKETVVPSRNTILLELATAYAITINASSVYYGAINDDISDYPDTTPEFLEQINELNRVNNYTYIPIIAPLINFNKEQVIREALRLEVPIKDTFSCYNPKPDGSPCNECISCKTRNDAIEKIREE